MRVGTIRPDEVVHEDAKKKVKDEAKNLWLETLGGFTGKMKLGVYEERRKARCLNILLRFKEEHLIHKLILLCKTESTYGLFVCLANKGIDKLDPVRKRESFHHPELTTSNKTAQESFQQLPSFPHCKVPL